MISNAYDRLKHRMAKCQYIFEGQGPKILNQMLLLISQHFIMLKAHLKHNLINIIQLPTNSNLKNSKSKFGHRLNKIGSLADGYRKERLKMYGFSYRDGM